MTRGVARVKATAGFLAALGVVVALFACGEASAAAVPETPRVAIVTMGPGDDFVTKFGHDALVVESAGQPARIYNFGMYTEESLTLGRILGGELRYFLHVSEYGRTIAYYRSHNRGVVLQELELDPAEARELARALAENARPENAAYHYDFGLANCTTRVRDALDRASRGALRAAIRGPSPYTFRDHALRFSASDPTLYFAFDLGLGAPADRQLDAWQDAFLPDRLASYAGKLRRPGARGSRPFVGAEHVVFRADRAPTPAHPPRRAPAFALAGLLLGGLFAGLGRLRTRAATLARGLLLALLALVAGVLGCSLVVLLMSDVHAVAHRNVNLLFCPPWALGLLPAAARLVFSRPPSERRWPELACLAGSLLGVLLMLLVRQDSGRIALLFVPIWAGVWLGARVRDLPPAAGQRSPVPPVHSPIESGAQAGRDLA
jgi:hypothetical protein